MPLKEQHKAFIIILLSFLILLVLQWSFPFLPALSGSFKNSSFLTYYFKEEVPLDSVPYIDSTIIAQLDTSELEVLTDTVKKNTLPPLKNIDEKYFTSDSFVVPAYANVEHLVKYFNALKNKKKKRVGYWGDSMIEGDLITQTLRRKLQNTHGGSGVGFVPMISYTAGFRRTITHSYGGVWKYFSLVKTPKRKAPYSLAGEYMVASTDSTGINAWASYSLPGKESKPWEQVHLLYGQGNGLGKVYTKLNNKHDSTFSLKDTAVVNILSLAQGGISKCSFNFLKTGNTPLYGVSFESNEGIILDNFSLRGNSGMPLVQIPLAVLQGFDQKLGYDLIVLQFGSNVVNAQTTDYHWYEAAMIKVVRHLQTAFPNASIVIMGVADKSAKRNGVLVTDPGVKRVLKTQYKVALKTGVCFFNLYEAMGGENSMSAWADADKPMANKDYTHFNFRGADKIGNLFFEFLMNNYRVFEKNVLLD